MPNEGDEQRTPKASENATTPVSEQPTASAHAGGATVTDAKVRLQWLVVAVAVRRGSTLNADAST